MVGSVGGSGGSARGAAPGVPAPHPPGWPRAEERRPASHLLPQRGAGGRCLVEPGVCGSHTGFQTRASNSQAPGGRRGRSRWLQGSGAGEPGFRDSPALPRALRKSQALSGHTAVMSVSLGTGLRGGGLAPPLPPRTLRVAVFLPLLTQTSLVLVSPTTVLTVLLFLLSCAEAGGSKRPKQDSVFDPGLGARLPERAQVQGGPGHVPDHEGGRCVGRGLLGPRLATPPLMS